MSSVNQMFDKFSAVKNYLRTKEELTLKEKFIFELTSIGISLIHENKMNIHTSGISLKLYKAIIEIMTLISYIDDNNDLIPLIEKYNRNKEYELYTSYKDEIKKPFYHFNNFKRTNKKDSVELDILNISNDLTELVDKYHNELSNYYNKLINNEIGDEIITLNAVLLMMIYMICIKVYPDIKAKFKETLDYEESFFLNHPLSQRYLNYVRSSVNLLKSVRDFRDDFTNISNMIMSFTCDKIFLYSEIFELKFVEFVNYLANFYSNITNSKNENIVHSFIESVMEENSSYIKLIYDESVILNHRCGYMITSYIDVYQEYSEAINFIDKAIAYIIALIGDADMYIDYNNLCDAKYRFDYENQYLVDKKE